MHATLTFTATILLGRIVYGLSVCLSVSMSVCLSLVTRMYYGKTAVPIEMPFGMWGAVGDSHHVLDGGPDLPHGKGKFCGGEGAVP